MLEKENVLSEICYLYKI